MTIASLTEQPTTRTAPTLHVVADPAPAVTSPAVTSPVAASLTRRLRLALFDLGLAAVLPEGWAHASGDSIGFDPLPVPVADRLVRRFEDLTRSIEETASLGAGTSQLSAESSGAPVAEQLCLFDPAPYTVPRTVEPGPSEGWTEPW